MLSNSKDPGTGPGTYYPHTSAGDYSGLKGLLEIEIYWINSGHLITSLASVSKRVRL